MNKNKIDNYIDVEFLDEDGYYTIDVSLDNDFNIYNELSMGKQLELNNELFDYIDTKSDVIPNNYKLKIRFVGRKLEKDDKYNIEKLIHEHYYVIKENTRQELDNLSTKMYLLLLFGVFLIAIYFIVIKIITFDSLLLELLSIIGTFSIWESIGLYVFERRELLDKYYGSIQNLEQVVEFYE